jgi:hypothetical protein
MGAGSNENQRVPLNPVNQQPVWFDMALSMAGIDAGQWMVPMFRVKRLPGLKLLDDRL